METIASLLDLSIQGENCSRMFYEGLADRFIHEKNISDFWRNMAEDEADHIKMLDNLRKSLSNDQLNAGIDKDIFQAALENSKVNINDVLDMVKNLNDAYILATLWENSEIYRVFEYLVTNCIPLMRNGADGRFARLHMSTHRKKLEAFACAFGDASLRKGINISQPGNN